MSIAEAELAAGERVVYPNQGVCRVVGTTEMEIAGHREVFVTLAREEDNATVMVPKARIQKVGLRRVAQSGELDAVMAFLAKPVTGPELDWKIRQRLHGEKMSEGGLMGLAEVVKGLTTLSDVRPLPPKERELYDTARHLLVSEIAASAQIVETSAEDAIDLALFPPGVVRVAPALAASVPDDLEMEVDLPGVDRALLKDAGIAELPSMGDDMADLEDNGQEPEEGEAVEEEAEPATKARAKERPPKAKAAPSKSTATGAKKTATKKAPAKTAAKKTAKPEKAAPKAKAAKPAAKTSSKTSKTKK